MALTTSDMRGLIDSELASLTALRRDLHRHPELGYEEVRTSGVIQRELDALAHRGVVYRAGYGETGVVAYLPATEPEEGREQSVGLRADIDALPIDEASGVEWSSNIPGRMHACGHDGHTAILLGAARVLSSLDRRPNPVTFLFQPAEEGGAGGARLCEEGALAGETGGGLGVPVGRVFGLHNWPEQDLGVVGTRPGPLLAATDEFEVKIRGRQAHAAFPHMGHDPVAAAAHVIAALQTISSRNARPTDSVVVTVATVHGGSAHNVIPAVVELGGTVRTLLDETRKMAKARFLEIVEGVSLSMGCRAEIVWHEGYPVTANDAALADEVLATAEAAFGEGSAFRIPEPFMGGEDFSYYGRHVPACFFTLGTRRQDDHDPALLHQPHFDFNDEAIGAGVEMFCRLALRA